MRLNASDRRKSILEAARSLFARQGFNGTTTKQIAALAGINEALIFRHFPHKEDLYGALITEHGCTKGRHAEIRKMLADEPEDHAAFTLLARNILERRFRDPELLRLLLFSSLEGHELSHRFFRSHISGVFDVLAERIALRIEQRRFRRMDPMLAARGFIGMLIYHVLVQDLFGGRKLREYNLDEVASTFAGIWLDGMATRSVTRKRRAPRARAVTAKSISMRAR